MSLAPCPSCQRHRRAESAECPFCGASAARKSAGWTAGAAALGLAVLASGCPARRPPQRPPRARRPLRVRRPPRALPLRRRLPTPQTSGPRPPTARRPLLRPARPRAISLASREPAVSLIPCPSCQRHLRSEAEECPFCGASRAGPSPSRAGWAGTAALGLAVFAAGCPAQPRPKPAYGAPPAPPQSPLGPQQPPPSVAPSVANPPLDDSRPQPAYGVVQPPPPRPSSTPSEPPK